MRALILAALALLAAATLAGSSHQAPSIGTYPHCRYGVAHAYGSAPQCAMPAPKWNAKARSWEG